MPRVLALLLGLSLVAASCSSETTAESTTTTITPSTVAPSTISTTAPSTTTTRPPVEVSIEGAPPELTALVSAYYDFAAGRSALPPAVPDPLAPAIDPTGAPAVVQGEAATGSFAGSQMAVISLGDDLLAAVDDGDGWRLVGGSVPSLGVSAHWGEMPRLVAVIGSDARPGENRDRARADSLHIVGVDASGGAGVVGIPRDSYVPVPGRGRSKINAALAFGGPELMLETLENTSDLDLDGYVLTGFEGFVQMAGSVLGGIEIDVPFDIADQAAKAFLSAGRQVLDGDDSLAFSRVRKTIRGGDFTRQFHGGLVILGALGVVQARGPLAVPGLIEGSEPWMSTDLTAEDLLTFSLAALAADVTRIQNTVLPGRAGSAGGGSVVFLSDGYLDVFEDLADGHLDEDW